MPSDAAAGTTTLSAARAPPTSGFTQHLPGLEFGYNRRECPIQRDGIPNGAGHRVWRALRRNSAQRLGRPTKPDGTACHAAPCWKDDHVHHQHDVTKHCIGCFQNSQHKYCRNALQHVGSQHFKHRELRANRCGLALAASTDPPAPADPPPPSSPSAAVLAAESQNALNRDIYNAFYQLQNAGGGLIVNVSISNGKFNGSVLLPYTHANYDGTRVWADEINPLLVFSVSTSASEVIFSGASSGEDGTLLVNLPITVKGGTGAPKLVLQRLRIMSNADAPAVLVTDEADLSVRDCYFMENPASAIRQISGRLEVRSSIFYGNGAADTSGGALQLLGGVSEILSSTLEANAGLYGAAVYVFDAVVSLGERTLLTNNFASKAGNSVSIANGTFNYLLPAPLGRWVGPVHQDGYRTNTSWLNYGYTSARDGYGTTTHAIHVFDDRAKTSYWDPGFPLAPFPPRVIELTQLAHIEEDFPYACEAGYYRSNDHADFQDGPQCEAICPAGYYCPLGTPHPIACFNASYCPTGSAWPIACPAGTYTQNNSLTNVRMLAMPCWLLLRPQHHVSRSVCQRTHCTHRGIFRVRAMPRRILRRRACPDAVLGVPGGLVLLRWHDDQAMRPWLLSQPYGQLVRPSAYWPLRSQGCY